jgi:hypothetical protein
MRIATKSLCVVAAVSIAMLAAVACGKPSEGLDGKAGQTTTNALVLAKASCNTDAQLGTCSEYRRAGGLGVEKQICEGFHGRFAVGGCPEAGQVGRCVLSDGEIKRYYGGGAHGQTRASAKDDCDRGGGRFD